MASERIQRRIDILIDEADQAVSQRDWTLALQESPLHAAPSATQGNPEAPENGWVLASSAVPGPQFAGSVPESPQIHLLSLQGCGSAPPTCQTASVTPGSPGQSGYQEHPLDGPSNLRETTGHSPIL